MTDAINTDNRNIESQTGYQEDRIKALMQRVRDLEIENADLRRQVKEILVEDGL